MCFRSSGKNLCKLQSKFLTEYACSDILYIHNDVRDVSNYKDGTDTFCVAKRGGDPGSSDQKLYVL